MSLEFIQPLAEMSTTNILGVKRGRRVRQTTQPPSESRLARQCGIIDMSQPYRPPRPVTGIALLVSVFHDMTHFEFGSPVTAVPAWSGLMLIMPGTQTNCCREFGTLDPVEGLMAREFANMHSVKALGLQRSCTVRWLRLW
jgi:hypothetical protein